MENFTAVPNEWSDHVADGRLTLPMFNILWHLLRTCTWNTGVWTGEAERIRYGLNRAFSVSQINRYLTRLHNCGYISRLNTPGRRGGYKILISNYAHDNSVLRPTELKDWRDIKDVDASDMRGRCVGDAPDDACEMRSIPDLPDFNPDVPNVQTKEGRKEGRKEASSLRSEEEQVVSKINKQETTKRTEFAEMQDLKPEFNSCLEYVKSVRTLHDPEIQVPEEPEYMGWKKFRLTTDDDIENVIFLWKQQTGIYDPSEEAQEAAAFLISETDPDATVGTMGTIARWMLLIIQTCPKTSGITWHDLTFYAKKYELSRKTASAWKRKLDATKAAKAGDTGLVTAGFPWQVTEITRGFAIGDEE